MSRATAFVCLGTRITIVSICGSNTVRLTVIAPGERSDPVRAGQVSEPFACRSNEVFIRDPCANDGEEPRDLGEGPSSRTER